MKARIKIEYKDKVKYSSYKEVSRYEITKMKDEIIENLRMDHFQLDDIHDDGKDIMIIPSEVFKNSIITIECQEA